MKAKKTIKSFSKISLVAFRQRSIEMFFYFSNESGKVQKPGRVCFVGRRKVQKSIPSRAVNDFFVQVCNAG